MRMKKIVSIIMSVAAFMLLVSCSGSEKEPVFKFDSEKIAIMSLTGIDGLYVEKGGQDEVTGVAAITVKNNSERMLEYAKISFRVNDFEKADFIVSALPAGKSAIVMETTARPFSSDDTYAQDSESSMFSYCDSGMNNDKFKIKTDGSTITVENETDADATVQITYKYFKNGMYYGGIAFRGSFEDIAAGGSLEKTSDRFNDTCKIVNVTYD